MFFKLLNKMRSQKGFTLLELIFVVIILAVLAGVALINLGGSDDDAKLAAVKTDMQSIATALKVYKAKIGEFPATLSALTSASGTYKAMLDSEPTQPSGSSYTYEYISGTGVTLSSTKPAYSLTIKD
jgi:prepilin-type N-terminal cleavage/methylation domain-containing protein